MQTVFYRDADFLRHINRQRRGKRIHMIGNMVIALISQKFGQRSLQYVIK